MMAPGSTYIGLNAGQSKFRNTSGLGNFPFDSKDKSVGLYAGSYFTPNFGLELSYLDLGESTRAGGKTEAKAGTVALIGKFPLNESFNLLAKLGATYSQVDASALAGTGIATGRKSGWGPSYGIGAEYNFTQNVSAVLQYDEYRMPYPGGSKEKNNNTSVGIRYRF
jgi:OmpA-OmpF porin, OOP family